MLLKIMVSLVFCCCCWSWSLGSVSAAEITVQELNLLENNLNRLEVLNQRSQMELQTLKSQLSTLNKQLNQLHLQSTKQEESLKIANASLQKYEEEIKQTKMQRNCILAILAILLIKS